MSLEILNGLQADTKFLNVSNASLYSENCWMYPFMVLRDHSPVYRVEDSDYGPFWSISTYNEIKQVERNPGVFSSQSGGINLSDVVGSSRIQLPMFIALDGEKHLKQRRSMSRALGAAALSRLGKIVEVKASKIFDSLPRGRVFDWVERVSVELTGHVLTELFGVPSEDGKKLLVWSDWASDLEALNSAQTRKARMKHVLECSRYFKQVRQLRLDTELGDDVISEIIRSPEIDHMDDNAFLGTIVLFLIAGNDTTRNSISAAVVGLHQFPNERSILYSEPLLVQNAAQEIIRWHTPISHMRRTATSNVELAGRKICAGDKLALWYISGNHDETIFGADAKELRVTRTNAKDHLAFGHGVHRCLGARLAALQLIEVLRQMIDRRLIVNLEAAPCRTASCFVHGFDRIEVRVD